MDEQRPAPVSAGDTVMAALSYVGFLFLVPLFAAPRKSEFAKFHLRQGMFLFALEVLFWMLPGRADALVVLPALLALAGLLTSAAGKAIPLPLVGKYVQRINV